MPDPVIKVENLGKRYLVGHQASSQERYTALRDVLARNAKEFVRKTKDIIQGKQVIQGDEIEDFWALKNVTFEVNPGEVIGIIGRNGAGKSTLLKVLSRITEPSEGRITIQGRVASLLEVGTGFHPELTGRENIFLNGAILGMSRAEIRKKFDEIVAFAEVEKFLDTPVKRYSSGMYVRLAFAVAAHLEPEILVVDEVLAVGDAAFQKKCLGKMKDVAGHGRTVLFVSHNMSAVQSLCESAIFLNNGSVEALGKPEELINRYLGSFETAQTAKDYRGTGANGDSIAVLLEASLLDHRGETTLALDFYEGGILEVTYQILKRGYLPVPNIHFFNQKGDYVMVIGEDKRNLSGEEGIYKSTIKIPGHFLNAGQYTLGLAISTIEPEIIHFYDREGLVFNVFENMEKRDSDYRNEIPGVVRPKFHSKTIRVC